MEREKSLYKTAGLLSGGTGYIDSFTTYKRCINILSLNERQGLVSSIINALMAETKAGCVVFWMTDGVDGVINGKWEVVEVSGEINHGAGRLPKDDTPWMEKVIKGEPFYKPGESRDSFFVPILTEDKRFGLVELAGKAGNGQFDERDLKVAGIIAEFSRLAINNAETFKALQTNAFMEEDFNVYTYAFFRDYFKREISLASRYQRPFSILYLKVDNLSELLKDYDKEALRERLNK